ncbi:MAG TPA: GNAT family N-acetyltransferase [Rhodanobacteraceae bacterium]|nr:GNAT family N-acetyltransferase [Rhodanobacteraceae bacterium]
MKPGVAHDPEERRFEAVVEGQRCTLDYELAGKTMTITHTRVPEPVEGRGIAAALMEAALSHARASGWRVVPKCSYAVAYLGRHREWADILLDA